MKVKYLNYTWRQKNIVNRANENDSIAVFSPTGELIGIITCDPDGVFTEGNISIDYKYIGNAVYEVLMPNEYIAKEIVYAYKTNDGEKFLIRIKHDVIVEMEIGERITDKLVEKPKTVGYLTADGNLKREKVDIPLEFGEILEEERFLKICNVFGIKDESLIEKAVKFGIHKYRLIPNEARNVGNTILKEGKITLAVGYTRNGFRGYFIVRKHLDDLPVVMKTFTGPKEALESFKALVALEYGNVPDARLFQNGQEPIIETKDKLIVIYNGDRVLEIPKEEEYRKSVSVFWNKKEKEIASKVIDRLIHSGG